MVFVADIAFGQNIVAAVVLRIVFGAAAVARIDVAFVFGFMPLAAGEHQQALGVFGVARRRGGYAVAVVAAAVAVFQAEESRLVGIDEIARRISSQIHHPAQRIAAVERGIRPFHNIRLLERIGFDQIAAGNRAVAAAARIRLRQAHTVHHHQDAVAVDAADIHARVTAPRVVRRHPYARFV